MTTKDSSTLHVNTNPIALEADVAYFSARLELVGDPQSRYQSAQLKVYQALTAALEENLRRLQGVDGKA